MATIEESGQTIFSAHLVPHRSLDQKGARRVLLGVALVSVCASSLFATDRAWPIVGFFGLDVALLWFAFRAHFQAAKAYEDVRVTPVELAVAKISSRGGRSEWSFNPLWVRLVKVEDPAYGLTRLSVSSRGRQIEVGGFLGADARKELAGRLAAALAEARRGPRFS